MCFSWRKINPTNLYYGNMTAILYQQPWKTWIFFSLSLKGNSGLRLKSRRELSITTRLWIFPKEDYTVRAKMINHDKPASCDANTHLLLTIAGDQTLHFRSDLNNSTSTVKYMRPRFKINLRRKWHLCGLRILPLPPPLFFFFFLHLHLLN